MSRQRLLLIVVLGLGGALRLGYYAARPSLTIDETMLSLDLGLRTFPELLHPLASLQTGPLLFSWGVKLCIGVLGMSEYALRLLPFVAGLLVPWLVWAVGRRVLPEPAALLAAALAAFSPALVQYSVTAKPYITDALFTLLAVYGTLDVLDRPDSIARWLRLGAVGIVAVLGSIPAPFALAGAGAAIMLGVRPLNRRSVSRLTVCVVVWGGAFALVYISLYRPVAAHWYMRQFWDPASFTPGRSAGWWNLARSVFMSLMGRAAQKTDIHVFTALAIIGFWTSLKRLPRAVAALIGVPVLVLLFASALHLYPLAERLLIFAVPTVVLALAAVSTTSVLQRWRWGWVPGVVGVLVLIEVDVAHPYQPAATRPAVQSILKLALPREPIYVASEGVPAWAFYTTDWNAPDTAYLDWIERVAGTPGAPAFHNSPPRGHPVRNDEGADLQESHGGRVELLGLASGIQWQEGRGFGVPIVADSGWAAREAVRIKTAAAPTVWTIVANAYPTTVQQLNAAVVHAGGVAESAFTIGGVRLARFRFPG